MTTRWRDPSNPSETIAKAWLDNRDGDALELVSALLDQGKGDAIDAAMSILDEEGEPEAFDEMAEILMSMAEATEAGCLVAFPFEAGRVPDAATLRLSLKPVLGEVALVLHPKALEPASLLGMPPYLMRSVLVALLDKGKVAGMPWTLHDGNGPGVLLGALPADLDEVSERLDAWLQTTGKSMGCGLPCAPSGLPKVLDSMEARRRARQQAEAEMEDFLRIAAEECGGPVLLRTLAQGNATWAEALSEDGQVVDARYFHGLPDAQAESSTTPEEATPLAVGRRAKGGGLSVIRGGRS